MNESKIVAYFNLISDNFEIKTKINYINSKVQEKLNRRQIESSHEKNIEFNKLKNFLDLKIFPDFNTNPKILLFREKVQKKKELEQILLERKNLLEKIKENYMITKNRHTAIKSAIEETKISKQEVDVEGVESDYINKFEIQTDSERLKRNIETSSMPTLKINYLDKNLHR